MRRWLPFLLVVLTSAAAGVLDVRGAASTCVERCSDAPEDRGCAPDCPDCGCCAHHRVLGLSGPARESAVAAGTSVPPWTPRPPRAPAPRDILHVPRAARS